MDFNFIISGSRLIAEGAFEGFTGNVNTYFCNFDIRSEIENATWFCVFRQGDFYITQMLEDGRCIIPAEVLECDKPAYIGCFATSGAEESFQRISTNWVIFNVEKGAYCEASSPQTPMPDVWEVLLKKHLPYIGENGNWFVFDIDKNTYSDSNISAKAIDGYTPVRGTDYWTDNDKEEIEDNIKSDLLSVIVSSGDNITLQNNQEVRLGELSALSIALPSEINLRHESYLSFTSGETATILTYSGITFKGDDCDSSGDFVPSANTNYEIAFKNIGTTVNPNIIARVGSW